MVFRYFILESEELSLFLHSFLWYTGWDNIFEKYLHDRNKLIGTGGPSIRHDEYTFQWQMHDISCYILFIKLYEEHEISVIFCWQRDIQRDTFTYNAFDLQQLERKTVCWELFCIICPGDGMSVWRNFLNARTFGKVQMHTYILNCSHFPHHTLYFWS